VVAIVTASGLKDLDISIDAPRREKPLVSVEDAWKRALERTKADESA
jgi:MoaA/NifB/PqqE/SkfB family radical SAM enzyme